MAKRKAEGLEVPTTQEPRRSSRRISTAKKHVVVEKAEQDQEGEGEDEGGKSVSPKRSRKKTKKETPVEINEETQETAGPVSLPFHSSSTTEFCI